MTKKQQHSIDMIKTAFRYLEDDLIKELKRFSEKRKKEIEKGFISLRHHFEKLNIGMMHLKGIRGVFYNPKLNMKWFNGMKAAFEEWEAQSRRSRETV